MSIERYILVGVASLILGISLSWGENTLYVIISFLFLIGFFRKKSTYLVIIILCLLLGFSGSLFYINKVNHEDITKENQNIKVRIEKIKNERYIGKIIASENSDLLSRKIIFFSKNQLEIGNNYEGIFKLNPWKGKRIKGGFNEKIYYLSNDIFYKGSLLNLVSEESEKDVYGRLFIYREKILSEYEELYSGQAKGLIRAIIFGDRSLFEEETSKSFQLLGISHLLAVSGLHAGIIAAISYKIFSPGGFIVKNLAAALFLLAYGFLAGFGPSVSRAGLMFVVLSLSRIKLRYGDPYTIIAISAGVQIFSNPFVIFSAGFQLSYITILGIVLFSKKKNSGFSISLAATLSTVPLLIIYFNKISILGVIINLLYVPMFSLITLMAMLGLLFFLTPFFGIFSLVCHWLDYLITIILEGTIKISEHFYFLDVNISTPDMWEVLLYYALVLLMYFNKKVSKKILLSVFAFLIMVNITGKEWEISFLDVGQGDSVFISTYHEKSILIDGGPWGKEVEGFVASKGINKPDLFILTHPDADHISGLIKIMESNPAKKLMIPYGLKSNDLLEELLLVAKKKGTEIIYGYTGQKFYIDDTIFHIISPEYDRTYTTSNNHSLVILVTYKNKNILLTGDIEIEVLNKIYLDSKIDILKAPHHGSNTGLSHLFFRNNHIDHSVISVGENNRYGHPGSEFLSLLKKEGSNIYRTDKSGSITYFIEGSGNIKIETILD